jgi:polysaccharide deacetylase family protein (PEP-CTERM system associated)
LTDLKTREGSAHILTVNVEDYFQVSPLRRVVSRAHWHRFESRLATNTQSALDLLDEFGLKATFFALGWIADTLPEVIREIARRGHEVASKGYHHRSLRHMSPGEFREDALRSREALEKASQARVAGYRIADSWFSPKDLWALDILAEEDFVFDSSLRPIFRSFAGRRSRRYVHRHWHGERSIWEFPLSAWTVWECSIPIAGGNYHRQLPDLLMRAAVAQWIKRSEAPFVMYFHVWELDPDQPRINTSLVQRVRQYRGLEAMPARLRHYLDTYRFTSVADYLGLPGTPLTAAAASQGPVLARSRADLTAPVPKRQRAGRLGPSITVVIPCYNEERTLGYLAKTLAHFGAEMGKESALSYVFVDDASSDDTWARLNELFGSRPDCTLVRHQRNRGVAAATLTGVAHARTETVAVIDCDCSYDPEQLRAMLPLLRDDVALVTASPYHPQGRVQNVPAWRLVLSRGLSMLYRRVLHHQLATYTSCFRVYRRSAVANLAITHEGFLGIVEILARLDLTGARIVECPAVLEARLLGHSKMKVLKTIGGHLGLLAQLIIRRLRGGNATEWEDRPFLPTMRSPN